MTGASDPRPADAAPKVQRTREAGAGGSRGGAYHPRVIRAGEKVPEAWDFCELLDQYGTEMVATEPLPKGVRRGRRGFCFSNAFRLAADRGWLYAEGNGDTEDGFAVHHAWCVDDLGRVVDPTWPFVAGRKYVGMTLTVKAAANLLDGKTWGVLKLDRGRQHVLEMLQRIRRLSNAGT